MADTNDPPTLHTFQGHEIYPMPMFPALAVADVAAVSAWYRLVFTARNPAPDPEQAARIKQMFDAAARSE